MFPTCAIDHGRTREHPSSAEMRDLFVSNNSDCYACCPSQPGHFSNLPVVGFRQWVSVCEHFMNFPVAWSRHCLALAENAVKAKAITTMVARARCIVASMQSIS